MPAVGFLWLSDVSLPLFLVLGSCCDPRSEQAGATRHGETSWRCNTIGFGDLVPVAQHTKISKIKRIQKVPHEM